MAFGNLSIKHLQVDKANKTIMLVSASAVAIIVFGLFLGRALLVRRAFQSRVIHEKQIAVDVLKANVEAKNKLTDSYKIFTAKQVNVLGGKSDKNAKGSLDGDNGRIILDALPSKYDYPALISSMEKLLTDNSFAFQSISGNDDELNQPKEAQANPVPVEIPFGVDVPTGSNPARATELLGLFERSIRPFKVQSLKLTISGNQINVSLTGVTYYQPEKGLSITKKVVK